MICNRLCSANSLCTQPVARHFRARSRCVRRWSSFSSIMRMDCLIVVAAIILAAAGAPTVFSLLHRPGVKESVAARTLVAPDVSRPVTAGTSIAAQQPTESQEVKSSYVPRWGVWLIADLSESGAFAIT